jgi:hypothetical protein
VSTLQLLIVCFTAVVLAVVYASTRAAKPAIPVVAQGRVSLTVADGQSIEGVVVEGPAGFVTLSGASLRMVGGRTTPMGGIVKLREDSITLAQELDTPRPSLASVAERNGSPA